MKQEVIFHDLYSIGYRTAWDLQEALLAKNLSVKRQSSPDSYRDVNREWGSSTGEVAAENRNGSTEERIDTTHYLLFCEHPPVYTLGKSGKKENILISEEEMREKGIEFFPTNRGGDITFHGPEQLVGYPILDLEKYYTDIGKYLRNLEEVIIVALSTYGIEGGRIQGETGVWIEAGVAGRERKICAMGVRCSRWITMHGFALNVNTDLHYFDHIIPCGIRGKQVTSLQKELGLDLNMEEVKQRVKESFEKVFDCSLVSADLLG